MNLKKKLNILLISVLGISTVLALVFVGFLALQRNLIIPKVQASPGPACTVDDDLVVNKDVLIRQNLDVLGTTYLSCIGIEGGCLSGGQNKQCSTSAKDCRCHAASDIAEVTCPDGTYLISGGCDSDSGTNSLTHNTARGNPPNRWYCNWSAGVAYERAKAVCCRINVNWDSTLRTVTD